MLYKFSKISLLLTIISSNIFGSSLNNENEEPNDINKQNSMIRKRSIEPIPYSSFPAQINYYSFDIGDPISRFECLFEDTDRVTVERLSSGGSRIFGAYNRIGNFIPSEEMSDDEIFNKLAEFGNVNYKNLYDPNKKIIKKPT